MSLAALTKEIRAIPNGDAERALLLARHATFLELPKSTPRPMPSAAPPVDVPIDPAVGLPTCRGTPAAELVRAAIDAHGSLIVRNLLPRDRAEELRRAVLDSVAARAAYKAGAARDPSHYTEFDHIAQNATREFTSEAGVLAADSPRGHRLMVEALEDHGVVDIAAKLLGDRPAVSVEKCVLRKVEPQIFASWHQDGAFLGEQISTLDVWVALTPCGRKAPGLEIFPRRVNRVLPTGAFFTWDLSDQTLAAEYPGVRSVMPEFDIGDAIIFDQLCVHRSGFLAGMTDTRLALECWLFAPASVPADYTGLAL
jgi:hypothetical protein